ncbi:type II secretion system minor pseudopilin GspI [Sessilibacter corallicola]|uniref:type II secretion system minor pseudopilin GspI n=1 Tax=Sessilibacter corallicola TaxID=2904075 RepID=UPI001E2AC525|nr:type II secretion system minor pseudopilin GspI [Sessilibacter corallicola]MCE2027969.1 type II secretion system minor pseudopilin GspI [Sessilibacter corallicola]
MAHSISKHRNPTRTFQGAKIGTKQSGFTIIEVIIALTIVAVALPALLNLVLIQTDNTHHLRERTLAEYVARNQLNTQRINYQLTERILNGRQTGTEEFSGIEWHWIAESEETAIDEMRRINISVARTPQDARDNPSAHLSGFIYE